MTDQKDSTGNREYGIKFGSLAEQLATHEYPATTEEIRAAYGDETIELPKGSRTLREVFSSSAKNPDESDEIVYQSISYESADEVRQAIYNLIDSNAVGRERYSDRDAPTIGAERESDEMSF